MCEASPWANIHTADVGASALVRDIQPLVVSLAVLFAYEFVQTCSLMVSASQLPNQSHLSQDVLNLFYLSHWE